MAEPSRDRPSRRLLAPVLAASVFLLLLLLSTVAAVLSWRPPDSLDAAACVRFRIVSAAFLAGAVVLAAFWRVAGAWLRSVVASLWDETKSARRRVREFRRAEERSHRYVLYAVILLAAAFRLCSLPRPVDYDESYTFHMFVLPGVFKGLFVYGLPNNHVFHTALAKLASVLVGNRPWMLRLPVFVAGVLLVPMTYVAARSLYDKHVGLLAAGLAAGSALFVGYSTEARGYMILSLFFMAGLALVTRLKDDASPGAWFLFALLGALGIFTLPSGLYVFGILLTWLLLSSLSRDAAIPRRALLWKLAGAALLAGGLALALYSPVIAVTGLGKMMPASAADGVWYDPNGWGSALGGLWKDWNLGLPLVLQLLLAAGVVASAVFHRRLRRCRASAPAAVLLFLVPLMAIQRGVPYERVWTFLFPLYLIAASAGILFLLQVCGSWVAARRTLLASAAAVVLAAGVGFTGLGLSRLDTCHVRDAEEIVRLLKPHLKERVPVVMDFPMDSPLRYYFTIEDIPVTYLSRPYPVPRDRHLVNTVIFVVNREAGQSIDGFLQKCDLVDRPDAGNPFVIHRGECADVYQTGNNPGTLSEFDRPADAR